MERMGRTITDDIREGSIEAGLDLVAVLHESPLACAVVGTQRRIGHEPQ